MQSAEESYETLVRNMLVCGFHTSIKHVKNHQYAWRRDSCYKEYSIVKITEPVMDISTPMRVDYWKGTVQKDCAEPDCRSFELHSMPWGTYLIKIETNDGGVDEIEW
jgi:hypothetical protein